VCRALEGSRWDQVGTVGGQTPSDLAQTRRWMSLACASRGASGIQLTTNLELVRTRGI
jgi:hypothetical protein